MAKKVRKIEPVKQKVILELQPKKRVCAYCRVSTDSREQQNSFSAQVEYYKTFIGKEMTGNTQESTLMKPKVVRK